MRMQVYNGSDLYRGPIPLGSRRACGICEIQEAVPCPDAGTFTVSRAWADRGGVLQKGEAVLECS